MGLRVRSTPLPKHISSCITLVLGYLAVLSLSPFICKTKMIIYIAVRIKVCLAHSSHTSCSYYGILSSRKKQEQGIVGQKDNVDTNILKSGFPKKALGIWTLDMCAKEYLAFLEEAIVTCLTLMPWSP